MSLVSIYFPSTLFWVETETKVRDDYTSLIHVSRLTNTYYPTQI